MEPSLHLRDKPWLDPYVKVYKKINLKWIKNLEVRPDVLKLLEEDIGEMFEDVCLDNDFLDMTPKAQVIKEKINK